MEENNNQSYEIKIRILGNEIFALALATSSTSNKWIAIAIVSTFSILTVFGAYGDKFISMYKSMAG